MLSTINVTAVRAGRGSQESETASVESLLDSILTGIRDGARIVACRYEGADGKDDYQWTVYDGDDGRETFHFTTTVGASNVDIPVMLSAWVSGYGSRPAIRSCVESMLDALYLALNADYGVSVEQYYGPDGETEYHLTVDDLEVVKGTYTFTLK